MVFAYYAKLSRAGKAIYRKSDKIEKLSITNAEVLHDKVVRLQQTLQGEDRRRTEAIAGMLINAIAENVTAPTLTVRVLAVRPSNESEELHGLYEPMDGDRKARISVWMRTAKHKKVVAFRSFLRTLLHELCHHMDYEVFLLEDSFHTEGFFKRESHLFRQLLNEEQLSSK